MTKFELLYIRACKSTNPYKRLESIYRRFYLKGHIGTYISLSNLSKIIDKYNLTTVYCLLNELLPENNWKYIDLSEEDKLLHILVGIIRYTEVSKIAGYVAPCRFRREIDT